MEQNPRMPISEITLKIELMTEAGTVLEFAGMNIPVEPTQSDAHDQSLQDASTRTVCISPPGLFEVKQ
jgi:hypothetical protein